MLRQKQIKLFNCLDMLIINRDNLLTNFVTIHF